MAFLFAIVGLLMVVTGVKGTYAQFGSQVASDFTGSQPFTYWVAAILGVGSVGYIDSLRSVSRLFLALILVAMVLANGGFFDKLTAALKQGPVAPTGSGAPATSLPAGSPQSMVNADGSAPSNPTQAKANQYFNMFKNMLTGG